MTDYKHLYPFIIKWAGGLSKNTNDSASAYPCPDGSGNHTNKDITWKVWEAIYGNSPESIARWYAMSEDDWFSIFKPLYWDACWADQINSQRIADSIVEFVWGSGLHSPEKAIQQLLDEIFNEHLTIDGIPGQHTIDAINREDEPTLYEDIMQRRAKYFKDLAATKPEDEEFLTGWMNRLNDLYKFENENA